MHITDSLAFTLFNVLVF